MECHTLFLPFLSPPFFAGFPTYTNIMRGSLWETASVITLLAGAASAIDLDIKDERELPYLPQPPRP